MQKLLVGAVAVVGMATACGANAASGNSPGSGGAGSSSTTISTGSTSLGTVLTDAQGHTLYYFSPEQGGKAACTGACATNWPALTASGTPTEASGVTGSLGTVALASGGMEVTYNSWPLHTYAGDSASGQANGQGINSFGGIWYAATPSLTSTGGGASSGAPTPSSSAGGYGNYGGGY